MATQNNLFRHCPVCGSDDATPYAQKAELRLVRCRDCSMIYANPVPDELASGEYYDQAAAEYYLSPAKLESDYASVRFERELRLFRKYSRHGAVLDVGCSSGAFLFQLQHQYPGSYEVLGTDVSGPPLAYAESRGVPVARGNFLQGSIQGRRFDVVTFWAVLEHLADPRAFLRQAETVLNPAGLCFVLVPNMRSLAVRLLGVKYRYIYSQHLNYFTAQTLKSFVQDSFTILELRSMHFNPIVIWQDWRQGGKNVSNPQRAALLRRTTAYKQNVLLWPVKLFYRVVERTLGAFHLADNLAIVLRKRSA